MLREHESRDQGDRSTIKELQRSPANQQTSRGAGTDSSSRPSEGANPAGTLMEDF